MGRKGCCCNRPTGDTHATGQHVVRLGHKNASCRLLWRRIEFGLNGRVFAGGSGLCRSGRAQSSLSQGAVGIGVRPRCCHILSRSGITIDANKGNALCW